MHIVGTQDTDDAAIGSYTYRTAQDEDDPPELQFAKPTGRAFTRYRQFEATRQTIFEAWLDQQEEWAKRRIERGGLDLDSDEWLDLVVSPAEVRQAAAEQGIEILADVADEVDEDDEIDTLLEDDDRTILPLEMLRSRLLQIEFVPPEGRTEEYFALRERYLEWCVEWTVGCREIGYLDAAGEPNAVRWSKDETVCEATGADDPHEARKQIIASFGDAQWELESAPFDYAQHIVSEAGLSADQKKDSDNT